MTNLKANLLMSLTKSFSLSNSQSNLLSEITLLRLESQKCQIIQLYVSRCDLDVNTLKTLIAVQKQNELSQGKM